MKEVYTLNVLKEFKCTGSLCPRSCCSQGWKIPIEDELLQVWGSVDNDQDRKWFEQGTVTPEKSDVRYVRMNNNGNCVFLNDEKLCGIQVKYDHTYLPEVCREYPRAEFEFPHRQYKTATFSCPEIVRLFFLNNDQQNIYTVKKSTRSSDKTYHESKEYYTMLLGLDKILKDILASTDHSWGVRLFYISLVFSEAYKHLTTNSLNQNHLDQTRINLTRNLEEIDAAVRQNKLKPDPVTAGSFWKAIFELCGSRGIMHTFLEGDDGQLSKTIAMSGDGFDDYEKIYDVILQYSVTGHGVMRDEFGWMFNKYLTTYFSTTGFPIAYRSDALDIILVQCMVGLCLLQLLLWMQINSGKKLSQQLIEETIVEVHRRYVHSLAVANHLKESGHMRQIDRYCVNFLDLF